MSRTTFRSLRKRTGLSQKQFAKRIGINSQCISNIERDGAGMPAKYLPRIAKTCKVPVEQLVRMLVRRYEKEIRRRAGLE